MAATLRDVAERADVSVSTVSRILNKKSSGIPISEATRERVIKAAREVGYKPNIAARNLVNQRSFNLITTLVPQTLPSVLNDPFYTNVLRGIAHFCQKRGYAVTIYFADTNNPDKDALDRSYKRILEIPADGMILTTIHRGDQFIPRLQHDHIPFVHIGQSHDTKLASTAFVEADNYSGAISAVSHLIQQGHRHIATIAAPDYVMAGQERLRGYRDAMADAGLEVRPEWIEHGEFHEDHGRVAMQRLLQTSPRPTAVFAASDTMAMGAIMAIQEAGLSVPDDVAVTGFDNLFESSIAYPPLTTIHVHKHLVGRLAAEMLHWRINHPDDPPLRTITPTSLVIRQSCGAGRGSGQG